MLTAEEAAAVYERAKTSAPQSHMPESSNQLRPPNWSDYPHSQEKSDEGGTKTLALYMDSIYYAWATGDGKPALKFIDTKQCLNCAYYLEKALDDTSGGKYTLVPELTYGPYLAADFDDGDLHIELAYERGETWVSEYGEERKTSDPDSGKLYAKLHWTGTEWVIVEFAESLDKE